jgi:hypothetical protein
MNSFLKALVIICVLVGGLTLWITVSNMAAQITPPPNSGTGSGGNAIVQLAQQILSSPAASVTFSSISGSYTTLMLKVNAACDQSTATEGFGLNFNGDNTIAHYQSSYYLNNGSGNLSAGAINNSTFAGDIPCASDVSGASGQYSIEIQNYASTTFFKQYFSAGQLLNAASWGQPSNQLICTVQWNSKSAITSIVTTPGGGVGNFITGSTFTLYGIQ